MFCKRLAPDAALFCRDLQKSPQYLVQIREMIGKVCMFYYPEVHKRKYFLGFIPYWSHVYTGQPLKTMPNWNDVLDWMKTSLERYEEIDKGEWGQI